MIQLRWVWHDWKDGSPECGSICVGDRAYQYLEFRTIENQLEMGLHEPIWSEWKRVQAPQALALQE